MSYKVKLGFGGLCLFVHDSAQGLMHVLLPNAPGHQPTLIHDNEATGSREPQGVPRPQLVKNTLIDLTQLSTRTPLDPPPAEVADLGSTCRVPRKLVRDAHPGLRIATRVTFHAGLAQVDPCGGEGALWEFRGRRQLPIRVIWEIDVDDADIPLIIRRGSLNGSAGGQTINLYPHWNGDGEKEIEIWIANSPIPYLPAHLPPKTNWEGETEAAHFGMFYEILDCSGPTPDFVERPEFNEACYQHGSGSRGFDLTCIAARAPLGG